MKIYLYPLGLCASLLVGCQSMAPEPSPDQVFAKPELNLLAYDVFDDTPIVPAATQAPWNAFFTDPKLHTLIEMGLVYNKDIQQSALAIDRARAQYQIAHAQSVPSAGLGASHTQTHTKHTTTERNQVGFTMAPFELDFFGKVSGQKTRIHRMFLGTVAAHDNAQSSLIAAIAQSYTQLSASLLQYQLATQTQGSRQQSLDIANARFTAGVDSKAPSLQAKVALEASRLAVLDAQTNLLKTKSALEALVGRPIPPELMPSGNLQLVNADAVLINAPSALLQYRADIAKAEFDLQAAGAQIDIARAAFFPSITLTTSASTASSELSGLFSSGSLLWQFSPQLNLPIFDAKARQSAYQTAQIDQRLALTQYEKAIRDAFFEVQNILYDRATLQARIEASYEMANALHQAYTISDARFKSGLSSYLEVLDAQRALFDTQRQVIALEMQDTLTQIQLWRAMGGGAGAHGTAQLAPADAS